MRARVALLAAVGLVLSTPVAKAAVNDPAFVETQLKIPAAITSLAWANDGSRRLFVTLKQGPVRIVEDGKLLPTPFVTFSPLYAEGECGVLGVAFDPSFIDNGYVYFFVTVSATEQQIIRYRADGNVGTEPTLIVGGLPTIGGSHNGGGLGFGPDGKLYWSIGDNTKGVGVGNDLASLGAKVGRANADGSAPADNPFFDGAGPNNDYIWARGFRNPFTLAFQPTTGRLWLNVVGRYYEQIFTPQAGEHGGWDGDQYEAQQIAPYLSPVVTYDTNKTTPRVIAASGAVRTGGTVTITTATIHRLRPGAQVTLAGVTDASFNGSAVVAETPTLDSFTLQQAGPDAVSGNGTATPALIGGAVTGGAFWDSTAVPPEMRGNFLFGDYNSGRVMRTQLGADNQVERVEEWSTALVHIVDLALGPDGDMYEAQTHGIITRASYQSPTQALVVSPANVRLMEGGRGAFSVRLAADPQGSREVTVARLSGDGNVKVADKATFTFDSSSWSVPQPVVLAADVDADGNDDLARLQVASSGLTAEVVTVRVTDTQTGTVVGGAGGADAEGNSGAPATVGGAGVGAPLGGAGSDAAGAENPPDRGGAAGQPDGREGGRAGEPGRSDEGGQPTSEPSSTSRDSSGCDCLVVGPHHDGGRSLAVALTLLGLVLRRARRSQSAARH